MKMERYMTILAALIAIFLGGAFGSMMFGSTTEDNVREEVNVEQLHQVSDILFFIATGAFISIIVTGAYMVHYSPDEYKEKKSPI